MDRPKREPLVIPETAGRTWDDIFSNPGDIRVEILETGRLEISTRFFINLRHPAAKGLKPETIVVPVYCYLLHHEERGPFLVDAGLDTSFQRNTHGAIRGPLRKVLWPLKSFQDEGQDVASRLERRGVAVTAVYFTHLHIDHASGMRDLPKDINAVVGRGEPHQDLGPLFRCDLFAGVERIHEIDFTAAPDLPPAGQCADLFGDGSFWAVHTPGHRKGHVSYLVNGRDDRRLICGDACDIQLNFDRGVGPGFGSHDIREAQRSFERLRAFALRYPEIEVCFGHEIPGR